MVLQNPKRILFYILDMHCRQKRVGPLRVCPKRSRWAIPQNNPFFSTLNWKKDGMIVKRICTAALVAWPSLSVLLQLKDCTWLYAARAPKRPFSTWRDRFITCVYIFILSSKAYCGSFVILESYRARSCRWYFCISIFQKFDNLVGYSTSNVLILNLDELFCRTSELVSNFA